MFDRGEMKQVVILFTKERHREDVTGGDALNHPLPLCHLLVNLHVDIYCKTYVKYLKSCSVMISIVRLAWQMSRIKGYT